MVSVVTSETSLFNQFKQVVQLWHQGGSSGWDALECVVMKAIRLGYASWVSFGLEKLRSRFSRSIRVQKLVALQKESVCDWEEAERIYKEILSSQIEDLYCRKRLIACLKAQGRIEEAISAMLSQVEIFGTDAELWSELAVLYANELEYDKAVNAWNEVLCLEPNNFYNLVMYGELLFSSGEVETARAYFCKALTIRPFDLRTLWNLWQCVKNRTIPDDSPLRELLQKRITGIYASENPGMVEAVKSILV